MSTGSSPDTGIVGLTHEDESVNVAVGNDAFTTYFFGSEFARPYLHPLTGPSGSVTRHYPMEDVPGEKQDHVHHRGCWAAWGDVNGADNWIEEGDYARTVHRGIEVIESGSVFGRLRTLNDWVTADGTKLMEEIREYRFYNQPVSRSHCHRHSRRPRRYAHHWPAAVCRVSNSYAFPLLNLEFKILRQPGNRNLRITVMGMQVHGDMAASNR